MRLIWEMDDWPMKVQLEDGEGARQGPVEGPVEPSSGSGCQTSETRWSESDWLQMIPVSNVSRSNAIF